MKQPPQVIRGAYSGALNRLPTCSEEEAEFYALVDANANGNLLGEAKRFVSTLFETQASFDDPNSTPSGLYRQTPEYHAINPAGCNAFTNTNSGGFITDLYEGFLLREPEQAASTAGWARYRRPAARRYSGTSRTVPSSR